jgi:hypothetical protein
MIIKEVVIKKVVALVATTSLDLMPSPLSLNMAKMEDDEKIEIHSMTSELIMCCLATVSHTIFDVPLHKH